MDKNEQASFLKYRISMGIFAPPPTDNMSPSMYVCMYCIFYLGPSVRMIDLHEDKSLHTSNQAQMALMGTLLPGNREHLLNRLYNQIYWTINLSSLLNIPQAMNKIPSLQYISH